MPLPPFSPLAAVRRTLTPWLVAVVGIAALPGAASAAPETLVFTPEADTYVGSDAPSTTHGSSTGMSVDASPAKQSFVRFRVSGIAGRTVTSARLRMTQTDASVSGGRVWGMSSTTWAEALTWDARPAIDGPLLGTFPAVANGPSYEVELGAGAVRDGVVSYALDSTSGDGARWATRETATPPGLSVTVDSDPGTVLDGLSTVAGSSIGSSEPTYYSGNHRAAVTAGGRTLVVHGRHATGVQLAWRDPAGGWRNATTGAVAGGLLLSGTNTGDWPASIVVGRDASGAENAWVVWSGQNASGGKPLAMRRLTDLDSPDGPRVGPVVTIDPGTRGAYRGDIAIERGSDGVSRAVVLWSRRSGDSSYELVTTWFSELGADTPTLHSRTVLETSSSSSHFGSLVEAPGGVSAVARIGTGVLGTYSHSASAAMTSWTKGASGAAISSRAAPTGVALSNGELLVAVERDATTHVSNVYRVNAARSSIVSTLQMSGHEQPALAADGTRAWVVSVRSSDHYLVSRELGSAGWTASDRLEVGAEGGGQYAWPNTVRGIDGRLRVVFEGPGSSTNTSSALAFQRQI